MPHRRLSQRVAVEDSTLRYTIYTCPNYTQLNLTTPLYLSPWHAPVRACHATFPLQQCTAQCTVHCTAECTALHSAQFSALHSAKGDMAVGPGSSWQDSLPHCCSLHCSNTNHIARVQKGATPGQPKYESSTPIVHQGYTNRER